MYIDLVGLSAADARTKLLEELKSATRGKGRNPNAASHGPVPATGSRQQSGSGVTITANGDGNIQVAGDFNNYQRPPAQKIVLERRDGSVSPAQEKEIGSWIEKLAENTTGMSRKRAFGMWGGRFNNRFGLARRADLPSEWFSEAEKWYRQQCAILVGKLKLRAPDAWRQARFGSIHKAIDAMGLKKPEYYQQVAARLKMKPFGSLKDLTKRDLDRVYATAMRDARGRNW